MHKSWRDLVFPHLGKIIGGLAGFLIAIMIAIIGFWLTLFIFVCIAAGVILGGRLEKTELFRRLWKYFW